MCGKRTVQHCSKSIIWVSNAIPALISLVNWLYDDIGNLNLYQGIKFCLFERKEYSLLLKN